MTDTPTAPDLDIDLEAEAARRARATIDRLGPGVAPHADAILARCRENVLLERREARRAAELEAVARSGP